MPLVPYKMRQRLEYTKYGPKARTPVGSGATELDVNINLTVSAETSFLVDVAPMVTLSWLTSYGIELLAGKSDFKEGFRVIFGAPAPAGASLSYQMAVTP